MSRTLFWTGIRDENYRRKKFRALQRFAYGDRVAASGVLCAILGTVTATNGHDTRIDE
jgi:hypothetical protein